MVQTKVQARKKEGTTATYKSNAVTLSISQNGQASITGNVVYEGSLRNDRTGLTDTRRATFTRYNGTCKQGSCSGKMTWFMGGFLAPHATTGKLQARETRRGDLACVETTAMVPMFWGFPTESRRSGADIPYRLTAGGPVRKGSRSAYAARVGSDARIFCERETGMAVEGFTEYAKEDREKYNRLRWWLGMTWGDMFDKATDLYPEKIGLVDDTRRLTYAELREETDRLAVAFIEMGIKPRDWVLLQFPNWHEYIVAFYAMQKIGALTLLLIPRHNQSEINHLARLTKPVAWILPKQYGKIDYQPVIDDVLKENPQLNT